jgi:RecQ mediated genome instability protein
MANFKFTTVFDKQTTSNLRGSSSKREASISEIEICTPKRAPRSRKRKREFSDLDDKVSTVTTMDPLCERLIEAIQKDLNMPVSEKFIMNLLETRRNDPFKALVMTVRSRVLNAELEDSIDKSQTQNLFPPTAMNETQYRRDTKIPRTITVQVIEIEDVSRSRMDQLETLEREERGENVKGREIVRNVTEGDEGGAGQVFSKPDTTGEIKLLLEDAVLGRMYGIALDPIKGIHTGMNIGTKVSHEWRCTICVFDTDACVLDCFDQRRGSSWLSDT